MLSFKEFTDDKIFESKQVGIVYHFTTLNGILNLTKQNKQIDCEIFSFVSHNDHLSTTRSFTTTSFKFSEFNASTHPVRIAFNGDKISEKYKVKAINGLNNNDPEIFGTHKNHNRVPHKDEQEEAICPFKNKDSIFEMKKYIVEIQINGYFFKELEAEYLKNSLISIFKNEHLDIDVNIVRKWKPYKGEINESVSGENQDVTNYYIYKN